MKKLIILFVFILVSCHSVNNKNLILEVDYKTVNQVSIVAVGDNLIHHTIYESNFSKEENKFKTMYKDICPYIKQHKIAFVNQESILGGSDIGLSGYPLFNSPFEVGDALVDCGFNMISLANNHSLDQGEVGILNSVSYWKNKSVVFSGTEKNKTNRIKTFSVNNIKLAFVAYTYGTNGLIIPKGKEYLVNLYSYDTALEDINLIKNKVDVIIVSMHWGDEYKDTPNDVQIKQANELASLGVDIILGHHPHVVEPYDVIEKGNHKTHVAYSLGNFLSDQKGNDRLIGMAFSLEIEKNVHNKEINIEIKNPKAKLFYTYKENGFFKIIFFEDINDSILPDYFYYFNKKKELIKTYKSNIVVT